MNFILLDNGHAINFANVTYLEVLACNPIDGQTRIHFIGGEVLYSRHTVEQLKAFIDSGRISAER